jgi:hypothetical protein
MKGKQGGGWTVHKLIAMILAVLVLVLVTVGYTSGGLSPMFERLGAYYDSALANLGFSRDRAISYDGECFGGNEITDNAELNGAEFKICSGYCEIEKDGQVYVYDANSKEILVGGVKAEDLIDFNYADKKLWDGVRDSPVVGSPEAGISNVKLWGGEYYYIENDKLKKRFEEGSIMGEEVTYKWITQIEKTDDKPWLNEGYTKEELVWLRDNINIFRTYSEQHCK